MPYPDQRERFENIYFKVVLFSMENFQICQKLKNNNRSKIVSRTLSRLNISHVDRTPAILKVSAQTFFSCSRYNRPSTKHGYWSGPLTSGMPARILRRLFGASLKKVIINFSWVRF